MDLEIPDSPALAVALDRFNWTYKEDPVLAILGPPGSGKTALLQSLIRALSQRIQNDRAMLSINVDMLGIPIDYEDNMYKQVADRILSSAADSKVQLRGVSNSSAGRVETLLKQAADLVEGHLLLTIDHLESVPRWFAEDLGQRLRALKETTEQDLPLDRGGSIVLSPPVSRIAIIVTGSLSLHDLTTSDKSAFHMARVVALPIADDSVTGAYLKDYISRKKYVPETSEVMNILLEATGAEPCFLEPLLRRLSRVRRLRTVEGIRGALETIDADEVPHLEHIVLHMQQNKGLHDLVRRLLQDRPTARRGVQPDIDEFQLSGAVVLDTAQIPANYRFRNGIVKRAAKLVVSQSPESRQDDALSRLLAEISEASRRVSAASDLRACREVLQRVWEITTRRPMARFHLAFSDKRGENSRIIEIDETAQDMPASVRQAIERAIAANGGALGVSESFVSFALPLARTDLRAWCIATFNRPNASVSEYSLEHWAQFVVGVAPRLGELGMLELCRQQVVLPTASDASRHDSSRVVANLFLTPNILIARPWEIRAFDTALEPRKVIRAKELDEDVLSLHTDHKEFVRLMEQIGDAVGDAFGVVPELLSSLRDEPDRHNWIVCSDIEGLKLPVELLPIGRGPLMLRSGVVRRLEGSHFAPPPELRVSLPRLIYQLKQTNRDLRVLLVGTDPDEELPVDQELNEVHDRIRDGAANLGIKHTEFIQIRGAEASSKKLSEALLQQRPIHIFHFCGHGVHRPSGVDHACIRLNRNGMAEDIGSNQLRGWLIGAGIWLCFMSSCRSGTLRGHSLLRSGGLLDDVVSSGIPNFVGFRWPVSADSSRALAVSFYQNLFEPPGGSELITALLRGRLAALGAGELSDAWASSIAVSQCSS
jgi:energy-coupling factor transporter ATP-binding protein EcfA2